MFSSLLFRYHIPHILTGDTSATAADSTAKFEEWVKKGEEDEA